MASGRPKETQQTCQTSTMLDKKNPANRQQQQQQQQHQQHHQQHHQHQLQQLQHQQQHQQLQQLQDQLQDQLQRQQQLQKQNRLQNQQRPQHWSPYANQPLPEKPFETESSSNLVREANEGTHLHRQQQQQQPSPSPMQQQQPMQQPPPPPPNNSRQKGRRAACRRVVLKNNEIIIPEVAVGEPSSPIDGGDNDNDEWSSKGEISDITEDYLHIPFSSPLYSKVLQAFREAATHRPGYYESSRNDDGGDKEGEDRNDDGGDHKNDGNPGIEEPNHVASVTL
uniref:Uncharacterized protein n=1 Tax=Pseudo-nitzschia australis TaxID=44445 RepID=A0A7S4AFG8_9STRA